jgi:hypothetical protein
MLKPIFIALTVALAIASVVAGCGDSGTASLTKAAFVKQADAICEKADAKQEAAFSAYLKKHPEARSNQAEEEKLVATASLPPIGTEASELGGLPAPSGEENQVKAIVEGIEKALGKAEENPASMLQPSYGPFTEVVGLAEKYGFKACDNPL